MATPYKILCTICARSGSKGVKNKNIRLLNGKPLIAYTIEQAKDANIFEHIVISTDSDDIAKIAREYDGEVFFKREPYLANDKAGKLPVIKDALLKSEQHYSTQFEYIIDLDATAPLRSIEDIINAFNQCVNDNNDNLITATPSRKSPYFNLIEINKQGKVILSKPLDKPILRRQDVPKTYDMNASIYIWKRKTLLREDSIFLDTTGLYLMPDETSIDIDSALDFKFIEFLINNHNV